MTASLRSVRTRVSVAHLATVIFAIFTLIFLQGNSAAAAGILVNTEAFSSIDETNATDNPALRFGSNLKASLQFDRLLNRFTFNRSVMIQGALTVTGSLHLTTNTHNGGVVYVSGSFLGNQLKSTVRGESGQLLLSQGSGAPVWKTPVGGMVWYLDGTQAVGTSLGAQVTMPIALELTSVTLNIKGAPTGAALIVDIKKNGASIFTSKPQVSAGANTGGGSATFSDSSLPSGATMTLDVNQVGSTFAGSGLTVILYGTRRY